MAIVKIIQKYVTEIQQEVVEIFNNNNMDWQSIMLG